MIPTRTFEPGQVIIHENEPGETAFLIRKGRVQVTKKLGGKSVTLAYLGAGDIFGEMSMIDDKPRSATVTAIEPTEAGEIHQDEFFQSLHGDHDTAVDLLSALFERLREADAMILRLQQSSSADAPPPPEPSAGPAGLTLTLQGMTPEANAVLPRQPFTIRKFPYRVGRESPDPLVRNDWIIVDRAPWQISRHHVAFVVQSGKIGVIDRGSRLGSEVDGHRIGGASGDPGPVFLKNDGESTVTLGVANSPFRFNATVSKES